MPETITLFIESVEDISPLTHESMEITLSGVDLGHLVQEVGYELLLSEMKKEDVEQYYKDQALLEAQDDE